jgi:predicted GIY-YIG superfamily endonuclease
MSLTHDFKKIDFNKLNIKKMDSDIIDQLSSYIIKGYKRFKPYVYILKLENDKYWVGFTKDIVDRILIHINESTIKQHTAWTKLYKPVKIIEIIENEENLEKDKTLEYMRKYGWQNVRGYAWTKVNMKNPPKQLRND